jgi:uracil-DNA glycosylase family 4
MKPVSCMGCPAYDKRFVSAKGNQGARILLLGEAPGWEEERDGVCFVGRSGQELDMYLARIGLDLDDVYVTNRAKCRMGKKPSLEQLSWCSILLEQELNEVKPDIVVTFGAIAMEAFFPASMHISTFHGLPFRLDQYPFTILPIYHPAYALRKTYEMFAIMEDMKTLKRLLDGEEVEYGTVPVEDHFPVVCIDDDWTEILPDSSIVAIDTESSKGEPWCVSLTWDGQTAVVIPADRKRALKSVADYVARPDVLTVMHNAAYDYGVLGALGIVPARFTDTMLMAHALQSQPRGLKDLAARHLGLLMQEFDQLTGPYGGELQLAYLNEAASMEWEDVDPITKVVKGERKSRIPTNITKRIERILKDYHGKGCDLHLRWARIKPEEGREEVEDVLGPMPTGDISLVPHADAVRYAGTDAVATYRLYPILKRMVEEERLGASVDLDLSIVPLISDMTTNGIMLNRSKIGAIEVALTTELKGLEARLEEIAGCPVNPSSSQNVAQFLYNRGIFKSANKSTKAETLLMLRDSYPEVDLILKHRETKKLLSTYAKALPKRIGKDGRVRTGWSQITAITGRLASKNPNLQNIPARTEIGSTIRGAFVAAPGCSFISADLSQIEIRVAAVESGDPLLIQWLKEDKDVHAYVASVAFGVPVACLDKKTQRDPTKTTVFGILYGLSPQRLSRKTGWTVEACKDFMEHTIFGRFPHLKRLVSRCHAEARSRLAVRDLFGRRRVIPEVLSTQEEIVASGYRMSVNSKIQMGAGSIFKKVMADLTPVYKAWQAEGYIMRPVLSIHDEIVFETSNEIVDSVIPVIREVVESSVTLSVPIRTSINVASDWKGLK